MWPFKKKKVYCVEWHSVWDVHRRDFVRAKDEGHAWTIIKKREGSRAACCDKVYEIAERQ